MPTVLRVRGYRFHFYSDEGREPPHIHVRFEGNECKFWLSPILLANNRGIANNKLREIENIIYENQKLLKKKYNEYHS